ncbi:MAG: hydrolase [Phycisphaerales bacterium]|nr:hydrolase [Phycisphaerales bacterium]
MPLPPHVHAIRQHIGHDLLLMPAVSVLIFNDAGEILLGQRSDNGKWATIGGICDPGESPAETAVREALEETGVTIEIERVSGVYGSPVIQYPNQDLAQYVTVAFRCRIVAGTPRVADDESLDVRFFALDALPPDVSANHRTRIEHARQPGRDIPAAF